MSAKRGRPGAPLGPRKGRKSGPPRGLGKRILAVRLARGLSQEQAAEKIGCTRLTFSRWERSETTPRGVAKRALDSWLEG